LPSCFQTEPDATEGIASAIIAMLPGRIIRLTLIFVHFLPYRLDSMDKATLGQTPTLTACHAPFRVLDIATSRFFAGEISAAVAKNLHPLTLCRQLGYGWLEVPVEHPAW
jgi:hypothetical protein